MPERFRHGVASFEPLQDGVLLWTLVEGGGSVRWVVAADEGLTQVVAEGTAMADEGSGTVVAEVTGLAAGTRYWYRFEAGPGGEAEPAGSGGKVEPAGSGGKVEPAGSGGKVEPAGSGGKVEPAGSGGRTEPAGSGGRTEPAGTKAERSPVGRTRTLPGPGADRFRLAATCCARYAQEEFGVYRALAEADVDLVVHLGDYIYEDAKGGKRPTEPDRTLVSLDDYRTRHSLHRRDPALQALHAAHPVVAVWDDHDLADNAWRDGAKSHDPEEHGDWADRKAAAVRAHNEFLPKRLADPDDPTSAWRRLDAGDLVSVVLTETRAARDEPVGSADDADIDDPERTILGPRQRAWVLDQAADPGPAWLVVASGTVVSELEFPAPDSLDGAMPEKYAVKDGLARNSDQWDGYPAERTALAEALGRRGGPTLVLSGDIHSAWAVEGLRDAEGRSTAVELVCPPAATTPAGRLLPPGIGEALGTAMKRAIEGARWIDLVHYGFLVVDIERAGATATWWWVDPEDATSAERGRVWKVKGGARPRLVDPLIRRHPLRAAAVAAAATVLVTLVLRRIRNPH